MNCTVYSSWFLTNLIQVFFNVQWSLLGLSWWISLRFSCGPWCVSLLGLSTKCEGNCSLGVSEWVDFSEGYMEEERTGSHCLFSGGKIARLFRSCLLLKTSSVSAASIFSLLVFWIQKELQWNFLILHQETVLETEWLALNSENKWWQSWVKLKNLEFLILNPNISHNLKTSTPFGKYMFSFIYNLLGKLDKSRIIAPMSVRYSKLFKKWNHLYRIGRC